jgi:NAD(P)-dependent dehydrogenase (short-subunit alcohol dehydrogenase family)
MMKRMTFMTTRTMIMTGAAKGIGAGVTKAFIDRGHKVVANSLDFTNSALARAQKLALVDGHIGKAAAAPKEKQEWKRQMPQIK